MYIEETELKDILDFHCPRYNELPSIALYKDQVILYIEETLKPLNLNPEEKLLTPTMLNNYVKQKVVSPPLNRRYNEKHLAYLIVVCLLKQVYSLTEICELIKNQIGSCPTEVAYDLFCDEFVTRDHLTALMITHHIEDALKYVFSRRNQELSTPDPVTLEREIAQSVVLSLANKLFIQKYLIEKRKMN